MTRDEFLEINDWGELVDFCYENNIYTCDDIYDDEQKDNYIEEHLGEWASDYKWRDLLKLLDEIPDSADWYIIDDYGEISEATDEDFEYYKERTLEEADDKDLFDEDDEPYEEESIEDYTLDEETEEEEEFVPEVPLGVLYEQSAAETKKDEEITIRSLF